MSNFWKNVLRYPRFFISSLAGSILVILTPFKNLFKVSKFRTGLIFVIVVLLFGLYNVIIKMVGLQKITSFEKFYLGRVGFEPTQHNATDLQSVSFNHSDTDPFIESNYIRIEIKKQDLTLLKQSKIKKINEFINTFVLEMYFF